jgi:hypothetical protein
MRINVLAWLFAPPKKTRRRSGLTDQMRGWVVRALLLPRGAV